MSIQDVETLLRTDTGEHEQALSKTISSYGFAATQEQFDALVNLRYHKYRLGADIDDLIDLFNNGIYPAGI